MTLKFVDPIILFVILGVIIAILGAGSITWGIMKWIKGENRITGRLRHYVASGEKVKDQRILGRIIPREIDGSLFNRTIMLWVNNVIKFLGKFTPEKQIFELNRQLAIAGYPLNMHAREFYAFRFLLIIVGGVVALLINSDFSNIDFVQVLIGALIVITCFLVPTAWLKGIVKNKRDEILRDLPDALDMLSVCASAGLGFDQSLQKISDYWQTALGFEIKRVTQEMEMGVSRSSALKNMSDRLGVDDLSRFIAIIIQAETMGMSYSDVLHSQASQMRVLRQYRAREIANKLPVKMIVPVATLIFPALIAVILAPIIPTLLDLF